MPHRGACCLLLSSFLLASSAQNSNEEPKTPNDWFKRAYDAMDLRIPGSAPFHMKVSFHAFPGLEFRGAGQKDEIITGDGSYEETWMSVSQWRREIWLNEYHAVEVMSPASGRKMKADSEYQPSRILMLLSALYYPIPRNLVSSEIRNRGGSGWKLDHIDFNGQSLGRISKSTGSESAEYTDSFVFQQHGLLNLRNDKGMTTVWSNFAPFAGKFVPNELNILAGDRKLLTATITIEAPGPTTTPTEITPGNTTLDQFDLPVGPADPAATLRPLQFYEVRLPDISDSWFVGPVNGGLKKPAMMVHGVLDKHGRNREVEVIYGPSTAQAGKILDHFRSKHYKPATIDGSPCEYAHQWIWM